MRYLTPAAATAALLFAAGSADAQPNNHRFDAYFKQSDKNNDGFLDAAELAKAFRGPAAKVIPDKAGAKETHPDHAFLDAWDANKDGKISTSEFERYESKAAADARAVANRSQTYTRGGRAGYRSPLRHRGAGRGYGTNPYRSSARYAPRGYLAQRSAYGGARRYGAYTPSIRGGYRGVQRHHHVRRR